MKKSAYWYARLWSAAALVALAGCSEDELGSGQTAAGEGIVFGATAGYAGPDTKTAYGGVADDGNSQEINWVLTDQVEIYSPESSMRQVVYGVTDIKNGSTSETDKSAATLNAISTEGLKWGSGATQNFYAVYPAVESIKNTQVRQRVSFSNGKLTGYIPINQQHTITKDGSTWKATPNMDYLYMAAVEKDYAVPAYDSDERGVNLDFVPLTTTLEVTIVGPTTSPIASFNVVANDNQAVAGHFECDLANGTVDEEGYPVCNSTQSGTTSNYITVSTYWEDGETQKPLTLAAGEEITFNVFLVPHRNLSNLSIRVAGFNTSSKTLALSESSTPITLQPHMKTRVRISAPEINAGGTNEWITNLNDNVLVSQLSIPGTANSFSYMYSGSGTNADWHKAQTVGIEAQWNAGIRCFELRGPNNASGDDLANAPLECNRQGLGITFGDAVSQINSLLQNHPGEFAMIIPAFESGEGRFVEDYANDLNTFFRNTSYKYVTYGRDLTVGEARGGLIFIARITSEEDGQNYGNRGIPDPEQGVFVDEWGSLKDNWQRRGYNVPNWAIYNYNNYTNGHQSWWTGSMEYAMINGNRSSTFSPSLPTKGTVNFMHTTKRSDNTSGTAYIQDWNRVVKETRNYELYSDYNGALGYQRLNYTQYAYWQESFEEKKSDVWNTFLASIEDNSSDTGGSTFYINSLDGYYVDENIPQSYVPYIEGRSDSYTGRGEPDQSFSYTQGGMAGNIGGFATDINRYFYNAILEYGEDNIYGPMNIVILDRVYQDDPSSYLPSVIINNNYRFPLLTGDSSSSGN